MSTVENNAVPERLRTALADATLDDSAWDAVHREAEAAFGTDLCHTLCIDPRTGQFIQNRIHEDPEAKRKFLGVADIAEPVHYTVANPRVGLFRDAEFISEREMDASPFYEAAGRNGARHRIVLRLIDEPDFYSCLSLLRGDGRPAFTAE